MDFEGYPVILNDTAGIRTAKSEVEKIGINRAVIKAETSDLILILSDNDDFLREEPRHLNCISEINDEFIEYYPHPGQSDLTKFLKRENFDSRLSRLRKRFR